MTSSGSDRFGRCAVFTAGGIGDTLFHLGHFQAIAAQSRGGRVAIACKKGREIDELMGKAPFVDGVIGVADNQTVSGNVSISRVAAEFRARRFDTIFCLHDSHSIAIAALLAGIRQRLGYAIEGTWRLQLYTRALAVPEKTDYPHWMSKADRLLRAFEIPFDTTAARLFPSVEALQEADCIINGRSLVAIGVNASGPSKQWGGQRFAELVAHLAAMRPELAFLLFGAADTADVAAAVRAQSHVPSSRFVDLAGLGCPLDVSHAFLSRCLFYVGNDSSGANLAAFTGIPAVTLFGPTPPLIYSSLIHGVGRCGEGPMDGIPVEAVVVQCAPFLERVPAVSY